MMPEVFPVLNKIFGFRFVHKKEVMHRERYGINWLDLPNEYTSAF